MKQMTKCANFICLNESSGLRKNKGLFCRQCLQSNTPFVYECYMCGQTFTANTKFHVPSNIPKYCGIKCRTKGKYINHGKEWSRKHYLKKKQSKIEKHYNAMKPFMLLPDIEVGVSECLN